MRRAAKDVPQAIQWHDGMQLSPQHFQESFHRVERYVDYHLDLATPFHYGINHVDFDRARLPAGKLRVLDLEAVMPDDTIILHTRQDPDLEVDLKSQADKMRVTPATVYLVVPREYPGEAVGGELARYRSVDGPGIPDENTGDNEIVIPRLVPKTRLIVVEEDGTPPARFVAMPIAKVACEGESFSLVQSYIAPCLHTYEGSPLGVLCADIVSRLREKANRLADRMLELSMTTDRDLIATLRRQIGALVSGIPPFEVLLNIGQAHPFQLYMALAGVLGTLAALARSPVPPPLRPYNHDDIYSVFQAARELIFRIVEEGILESFNPHPFDIADGRFRLEFQRPWQGRTLVLAAKARRGVRERELIDWVSGALIGSINKAREMQESRVLGIKRSRIERSGDLMASSTTFLFQLDADSPYIEAGAPLGVFNTADPTAQNGPSELILYVKATRDDPRGG
jgi:type VI secretion system protein ImpJ